MQKIFLLSILSFCVYTNAQISALPSSSAFQTTKYSGSNHETSGRASAAIPLYNFVSGAISVPISLAYNGNGVKVNQPSNWVGTNWILNAGGVVTRVVNSYPDELATERIFQEDILAHGTELPMAAGLYNPQQNDQRDFRADLFSFSLPGYSGSFYLKELLTGEQVFSGQLQDNNAELKIEFEKITNIILITTPEGVKYYFGGQNATEFSSTTVKVKQRHSPLGWNDVANNEITLPVQPLAPTSFYLYQIENYYGDKILIDYHDDGTKNFVFFEQHEQTIADGGYPHTYSEGCFDLDNFGVLQRSVYHGSVHNSKKISRIFSPNTDIEVIFTSSNFVLPSDGIIPTPQYDDRKLNSIHIFDSRQQKNLRNISLEYIFPANPVSNQVSRFFLQKVKFNNAELPTSPSCEIYSMDYNSPEDLPSRFSYKVDLLGYFNGQNNFHYIAGDQNINFDSTLQNLAVRESNFDFALKGALIKLHYPTGGHTLFEYEEPRVRAISDESKTLRVYRNLNEIPTTTSSAQFGIGEFELDPEAIPMKVIEDHTMVVNVQVNAWAGTDFYHDKILVEVTDLSPQAPNPLQTDFIQLFHANSASKTMFFNLKKDHIYSIVLKEDPTNPLPNNCAIEAFATFTYKIYKYFPAAGIRVKRISDYSRDQIVNQVRYYYKKAKHVGTHEDDSAVVTFSPNLDQRQETYPCLVSEFQESYQMVSMTTNPFAMIFADADNQVEYQYVTTSYGGDNFENGGVQREFKIEKQNKIETFFPHAGSSIYAEYGSTNFSNNHCLNGNLLSEIVLERIAQELFIKSEKLFTYTKTVDHFLDNVIVATPKTLANLPDFPPTFGTYKNESFSYRLQTVSKKDFVPSISINSNTPYNFPAIHTATVYSYISGLRGLPTRISTQNSDGRTHVKKMFYPVDIDIAQLQAIDGQYIEGYQILRNNNTISTPIQVENYLVDGASPGKLISRTRTLFTNVEGIILPYTQQSAKGNEPLKSKTFFSHYDVEGRLCEVSVEGGIKKSIVYGYKDDKVIAEISDLPYVDLVQSAGLLLQNLQSLSENLTDSQSIDFFETQLTSLRTLFPDSAITTFVYNPDGELLSTTDLRGRKTSYQYDECRNLWRTIDHDGNIISETTINLKVTD